MGQHLNSSSITEFEQRHVTPRPGRTLIVGSRVYRDKPDRRKLYADAVGIDMQAGEGTDIVQDLEEGLPIEQLQSFDHVECLSVLEHCKRPWLVAANIERMMKRGATIWVSVPFVWRLHSYPGDYWRVTPEGLPVLFPNVDWQERHIVPGRGDKLLTIKPTNGVPYFARTETCGFGVKR